MSCQYNLLFLFLCGFAALSVSTKECEKILLEGTSCFLKITTKVGKLFDIKWTHDKNGNILRWKDGKLIKQSEGVAMEEDGSLKFQRVGVKETGTYTFSAFDTDGTQIGKGNVEINVYAKLSKPTVKVTCTPDGNASLTCEANNKDPNLNVIWYEEGKPIQNAKISDKKLLLLPAQIKENKQYSCEASNPLSTNKSENSAVSCTGKGPGYKTLFGFDFWIMVGILAGGGALLLLLICVLVVCACRSCHQRKKHQKDEEELRLADLTHNHTGTNRSKQTARGQPAPPIPQEDLMPCSPSPETPPRTQAQPKAQIRARPPPPPQDEEEEYPPPLPHPRQKQHRTKRNQEPYRPME